MTLNRKLSHEVATARRENVPTASTMPVNDMSLCVTPCCTRSPITTSRIRSNGSSDESSRRPMTRSSTKMKTNAAVARRKMPYLLLGEMVDGAADGGERLVTVAELDALVSAPERRRVDLELDVDGHGPSRREGREPERDALALARRLDRVGLHGVDGDGVEPPPPRTSVGARIARSADTRKRPWK